MIPVSYALVTLSWLLAALGPMAAAVGRAVRDPRRWWPAPLFALVPLVIWTAVGAAALMIVLTGVPGVAERFDDGSARIGLLAGIAAWVLAVALRAPPFRWLEIEWPFARDVRQSAYGRYVPAGEASSSSASIVQRLIRAGTALILFFLS
jgi:hypothetical protein